MKKDIQNLGDAHSKVRLEAEHIQRMDLDECEHIGGTLLDDSGIASITILNKKVTVHASDVDLNGSDFSSHSIETSYPGLVTFLLSRVDNALKGTVLETNPTRFGPLVNMILSGISLGIYNVEETNSASEARQLLKENLCYLFAKFLEAELGFLMNKVDATAMGDMQ